MVHGTLVASSDRLPVLRGSFVFSPFRIVTHRHASSRLITPHHAFLRISAHLIMCTLALPITVVLGPMLPLRITHPAGNAHQTGITHHAADVSIAFASVGDRILKASHRGLIFR